MQALVKWIGGADDKKYTVGIPVEWIKGFDLEEFRSDKFDASLSYVVEWREKKKQPAGGWPVFDAYVIEVSQKRRVLENKLSALDGFLSPNKMMVERSASDRSSEEQNTSGTTAAAAYNANHLNDGNNQQKNGTGTQSTRGETPEDVDARSNTQVDQLKSKTPETRNEEDQSTKDTPVSGSSGLQAVNSTEIKSNHQKSTTPKTRNVEDQSTKDTPVSGPSGLQAVKHGNRAKKSIGHALTPSDVDSDDPDGESVISGCRPLKPNSLKRKSHKAVTGDQTMQQTLTAIQKELKKLRQKRSKKHADDFYSSDSSDDDMVEIGARGSGIFITDAQWKAARASTSYTAMGLSLLQSLFPMDVLLRSNLRGGNSKFRQVQGNAQKHQALDKQLLTALYHSVSKHWKTYNKTGLGTAINNKLTHLRATEKKRVAELQVREENENGE